MIRTRRNVGFNEADRQFHIEIKGLAEPKSPEATRICREDLNEVIAAFVQDKTDHRARPVRRGDRARGADAGSHGQDRAGQYPDLERRRSRGRSPARHRRDEPDAASQAAVDEARRRVARRQGNTALIDGVRKFAMDVRELDIDLIDRINPFGEAYAILAKSMNEETAKAGCCDHRGAKDQPDAGRGARSGTARAEVQAGTRTPAVNHVQDAWEKRMAEGVAFLARMKAEAVRG